MPRIWIDYCNYLIEQKLVSKTRHTFDKALMSLPVTQHDKIWEMYIRWAEELPIPNTAIAVYKRYLRLNPDVREDFVEYLVTLKRYEEALLAIMDLLNDDMFFSKNGKTKFDFWMLLCDIISHYPDEVRNLDCEGIIRHGLNKYTDEVGRLWVALASYYIRQGLIEKARDVFEEALSKVLTARDFSLVMDSYLKFEKEMFQMVIQSNEEDEEEEKELDSHLSEFVENSFADFGIQEETKSVNSRGYSNSLEDKRQLDINIKLFRIDSLVERRPFLLSDALLRQNPNNVKEWQKRVTLCKGDKDLMRNTYEKAVTTVDAIRADGRVELLWINYGKFLENINDIDLSNKVFHRATKTNFKTLDQIATIWCEWAEMHLRCNNYYDAHYIIKRACTTNRPKGGKKENNKNSSYSKKDNKDNSQNLGPSVSMSLKVWSFYADLEEQLGTVENVKVRINFNPLSRLFINGLLISK